MHKEVDHRSYGHQACEEPIHRREAGGRNDLAEEDGAEADADIEKQEEG